MNLPLLATQSLGSSLKRGQAISHNPHFSKSFNSFIFKILAQMRNKIVKFYVNNP